MIALVSPWLCAIERNAPPSVLRRGRPKAGTDWRDLAMLLLKFPELKSDPGPITDQLRALADPEVLTVWREIVSQEIVPEEEDEEFQ